MGRRCCIYKMLRTLHSTGVVQEDLAERNTVAAAVFASALMMSTCHCRRILEEALVVGMDAEWEPGSQRPVAALVQLACWSPESGTCVLLLVRSRTRLGAPVETLVGIGTGTLHVLGLFHEHPHSLHASVCTRWHVTWYLHPV